jgi:hypothetical protein
MGRKTFIVVVGEKLRSAQKPSTSVGDGDNRSRYAVLRPSGHRPSGLPGHQRDEQAVERSGAVRLFPKCVGQGFFSRRVATGLAKRGPSGGLLNGNR